MVSSTAFATSLRWSVCPGIRWSVSPGIDGRFVPEHSGQVHQNLHVLDFLKGNHTNLYRCCLMTYGCLLRPHEEIRLLTKKHFKNGNTEIHLAGNENKGGRIRVAFVPDY